MKRASKSTLHDQGFLGQKIPSSNLLFIVSSAGRLGPWMAEANERIDIKTTQMTKETFEDRENMPH